MSARKDDSGKPPLSLIPRSALLAEARVMGTGRAKYGAHNWRGGMSWSRVLDAALRHILAFADGEDIDAGEGGSGESHLANARCCLAFLIEYAEKGLGTDDRYKAAGEKQAPPPRQYGIWYCPADDDGGWWSMEHPFFDSRAAAEAACAAYRYCGVCEVREVGNE